VLINTVRRFLLLDVREWRRGQIQKNMIQDEGLNFRPRLGLFLPPVEWRDKLPQRGKKLLACLLHPLSVRLRKIAVAEQVENRQLFFAQALLSRALLLGVQALD
jgi:hypothetical protein